jgi:hypothetical protein
MSEHSELFPDVTLSARAMPYVRAAEQLTRESGVTIRSYRSSMSGRAYTRDDEWAIVTPVPLGPISFGVFAHEVAHQLFHRSGRKPRWQQEVEAEEYALEQFDEFGLRGRERYERRAAEHLDRTFGRAIKRSPRLAGVIREAHPYWYQPSFAEQVAELAVSRSGRPGGQ